MKKHWSLQQHLVIIALGVVILASLGMAVFLYIQPPNNELSVAFLDVGQGSGVLIQTPYGQNILIDGGDTDSRILRQLPLFMPFYDRALDLVILTHPHDDHVGGLVKVLQRYRVSNVLYTGVTHAAPAYLEFLQVIRQKNIPLTIVDRPQTVTLGPGLTLDIVYPLKSFLQQDVSNINNTSIAALLTYGQNKFLFTGDLEAEAEAELIASGADLRADVITAGHHGSDTSSTEEFLNAVKPRYAVIQVGKDNDFGHPSLRVLRRFDRMGIIYFRNDLNGWVRMVSDGTTIEVSTE